VLHQQRGPARGEPRASGAQRQPVLGRLEYKHGCRLCDRLCTRNCLELPCRNSQRWRQALKDLWDGGEEGQSERCLAASGSTPGLELAEQTRLHYSLLFSALEFLRMCHCFLAAVLYCERCPKPGAFLSLAAADQSSVAGAARRACQAKCTGAPSAWRAHHFILLSLSALRGPRITSADRAAQQGWQACSFQPG